MAEIAHEIKWWKQAVVYQIYPRSFMDSNGDGVGDLRGIISKLDYLVELGINVIWLCPMYKSPQDDNGYDISDYQDIHREFGTMEDFDQLLTECHGRGLKLIIDLVVNHTSDEHPWFLESRSSRENKKRDWYIWRDGQTGELPNNWESIFGGSVWELDEKTKSYFLHLFSRKQPDLNWENLEMRAEIYRMIRWWLDKGIDGFRIDAISHTKKEASFENLPNPSGLEFVPSFSKHMNVEGVQTYITDLCEKTFQHYDIMTVGEANGVSAEDAPDWVSEDQKKLNMLFQFEHIGLWDTDPDRRMDVLKVKEVFNRWQTKLHGKGWNALYIENHDIPRIVSKWGDVQNFWQESATSLAAFYFLMEGTPFIYQGQEIGMTNTIFHRPEDFNDVIAKNTFLQKRKDGISDQEIIEKLAPGSRDNARTPMQWTSGPQAGFTAGKPWLAVNPNYVCINVEYQLRTSNSILDFYKKLIQLRKSNPVLIEGKFELVMPESDSLFAYTRGKKGNQILVICNLKGKSAKFQGQDLTKCELLLRNVKDSPNEKSGQIEIFQPFEARIYRVG